MTRENSRVEEVDVSAHVAHLGELPPRIRSTIVSLMRGWHQQHPQEFQVALKRTA